MNPEATPLIYDTPTHHSAPPPTECDMFMLHADGDELKPNGPSAAGFSSLAVAAQPVESNNYNGII